MKLKPIHAIYTALLMAFALGGGSALGAQIADMANISGFAARLISAGFVTLIAASGVYALHKRVRFSAKTIGLTELRPSLRGVGFGMAVNVAVLVLVFGPALFFDLITFSAIDTPLLISFLVTNAVIAFLLEALPEEATMRGVGYSSLRSKFTAVKSALLTTGLFMLVPGLSTVFAGVVNKPFDGSFGYMGIVPEGENVIDYMILLFVFSLTLIAARLATRSRTIWTSIVFHLTFLTVNRILIQDSSNTGVAVDLASPDAILLVPLYTLLAGIVYYLVAKKRKKNSLVA